MAVTKKLSHHGGRVKKSIDYILNPKKVAPGLVYTMNCGIIPDTNFTAKQFETLQRFYHANKKHRGSPGGQNITSFHIIQSFKGDEATPEAAHKIAKELIHNHYGPHCQAVITTHIDKDNIHNHIVLNSVNFKGEKIYDNKDSLKSLRLASDSLCRKYGLSVIEKPLNKSLAYNEWEHHKNNTSWKEHIRTDIDLSVMANDDWNDFKTDLQQKGYKINDDPRRKFATLIRPKEDGTGYYRAVRFATLGHQYSEQRIKERLAAPNKNMIIIDGQNISFSKFILQKKMENAAKGSSLSPTHLKTLQALEILFRLIITDNLRQRRKYDITSPYSLMNDYYFYKTLMRFLSPKVNKGLKPDKEINLKMQPFQ